MIKATVVGVALLVLAGPLHGQAQQVPSPLTIYGSFGYVRNVSHFEEPIPGINQNGVAGSLRVMWNHGHLLSAGLEAGLTRVYAVQQQLADGATLDATLDAVPILVVFSMSPWRRVHLNVGTGFAISKSAISSMGSDASSSSFGTTFMGSAGYFVPFSGRFEVGGELKFLRIAKYDDNNLSLNLALAYKFPRK
jgi:hypothetical protein